METQTTATTTPTATVASRSSRHPRPLLTYRGARRNAGRNNWPGGGTTYEPYKTKPDRFRLVNVPDGKGGITAVRERYAVAQPRVYPAGWRSEAEKKARLASFAAPQLAPCRLSTWEALSNGKIN